MALNALLTTTITIERKTPTKDTSGGQVDVFAPVATLTNIPCTIQSRSGVAVVDQNQRQVIMSHAIYLKDTTGILRGDIVYHAASNTRFLIYNVGDMADRKVIGRIMCKEIS